MEWSEIVLHFLPYYEKSKPKAQDLVDYFHFRYLSNVGLDRWTTPNYITQKSCATKLMGLYGYKFSMDLIDALFDNYKTVMGREFSDIQWSLGMLSSERTGWILERLFKIIEKKGILDDNKIVLDLLKKPRKEWTSEEYKQFSRLTAGVK